LGHLGPTWICPSLYHGFLQAHGKDDGRDFKNYISTANVDTGKRIVQLPDAGSPPRRAAALHGPHFQLLVLKEDEDKSYT